MRLPERRDVAAMSWIAILTVGAVVAAVVALIAMRTRSGPSRDLGAVSSQWISEYRLGSTDDYSRR